MLFISYGILSALSFFTGFLSIPWFAIPIYAALATIPYFFIRHKNGSPISQAQDNPRCIWILIVFVSQCLVFGLAYSLGVATS